MNIQHLFIYIGTGDMSDLDLNHGKADRKITHYLNDLTSYDYQEKRCQVLGKRRYHLPVHYQIIKVENECVYLNIRVFNDEELVVLKAGETKYIKRDNIRNNTYGYVKFEVE